MKTEKITHQDVGQMDMYIRMYDELKRSEGDNPTKEELKAEIETQKAMFYLQQQDKEDKETESVQTVCTNFNYNFGRY